MSRRLQAVWVVENFTVYRSDIGRACYEYTLLYIYHIIIYVNMRICISRSIQRKDRSFLTENKAAAAVLKLLAQVQICLEFRLVVSLYSCYHWPLRKLGQHCTAVHWCISLYIAVYRCTAGGISLFSLSINSLWYAASSHCLSVFPHENFKFPLAHDEISVIYLRLSKIHYEKS